MRRIFLDTSYLQALADPRDNLHSLADTITSHLGKFTSITSEMVLTELLNALSGRGKHLRQIAIRITDDLRNDASVEIIPQNSEQFEAAFSFYRQRLDKGYSLTDCASMPIMRQLGVQDILTFDKHFQQEGFNALLRG